MPLAYAETHFKFSLPWSPLWRPWPELFLDAPSFCLPGRKCPFYLAVKDAHLFPIRLLSLEILIQGPSGRQTMELSPGQDLNSPLVFIPLAIDLPETPGEYSIHAKIRVRNASGREIQFWQANYPFLAPQPLLVKRLAESLPYPPDWQAGEMHCHSEYSSDPVEFGAPLAAMQAAGQALGLNFIQVTDHSYDFCYRKESYLQSCDPHAVFAAYRQEIATLNEGLSPCRLLAGEEVSCGNSQGENVHLLVMGHPTYLPGLGDGGRRGFNNRPDLRIEEVLQLLGKTPSFAAHPRVKIGRLQRFIFRRGPWDKPDLGSPTQPSPSLSGLQFWNGKRSQDYVDGRRFWVESLLNGHRFLPIGANDAHGDFNQNVGVKTPLFSLYRSRSHVLGKVRTLFPTSSNKLEALQQSVQAGQATATDGPFISLGWMENRLQLNVASSSDYGDIQKVTVVSGRLGERQENQVKHWEPNSQNLDEGLDFPEQATYARAEIETTRGHFGLTSAVFKPD